MSYSYLAFIAVGVALIFQGPTPEEVTEPTVEITQTEDSTTPRDIM